MHVKNLYFRISGNMKIMVNFYQNKLNTIHLNVLMYAIKNISTWNSDCALILQRILSKLTFYFGNNIKTTSDLLFLNNALKVSTILY